MTVGVIHSPKGFSGVIRTNEERTEYCGKILDIKDLVTYGPVDSFEAVKFAFEEAIDDYLKFKNALSIKETQ